MRCAYCNGPCDDRPVRYEAVCWDCHRSALTQRGRMAWIRAAWSTKRRSADRKGDSA